MSNKVSKIRENAEADLKLKKYTLYGTLAGSVIVTIGKLCKITEDQMIKDFAKLSNDPEFAKCNNVKEVCDYIINYYKMPEEYKKYIVLVYDEDGFFTPIVTILDDEGYIQPLDRDGNYMGVLANFGKKESIQFEEIYAEEDQ